MTSNDEKHLKNSAIFELPKRTKNLFLKAENVQSKVLISAKCSNNTILIAK